MGDFNHEATRCDDRVAAWAAGAATAEARTAFDNIPANLRVTKPAEFAAFIKSEAMMNGFDEAIVLNPDGHVSEGSAENIFIIRNRTLITPPVSDNILEGITRRTLMDLATTQLGLQVVERSIDRTELYVADEAFFCGTGVQVAAIASVDRRPIGAGKMGPITTELRDLYFEVVRGNVPQYCDWCTPVF